MPCSVQDYVFEDFSITNQPETFAAVNSEFNEVTWFYTSNSSTQIDRYVTYNYLEDCWSTGSLARTTWIDYGVYQKPYATEYNQTSTATATPIISPFPITEPEPFDFKSGSFVSKSIATSL